MLLTDGMSVYSVSSKKAINASFRGDKQTNKQTNSAFIYIDPLKFNIWPKFFILCCNSATHSASSGAGAESVRKLSWGCSDLLD